MPRDMFSVTTIDPESGEIKMRRSHPMINNFNQSLICVCRCNMDIKFIWSGTDAKALVYYCTDYITKTTLSFHDTFSLVQKAIAPNDSSMITESSVDKARKLVLRCYNSLASQQELSGVQAATHLLDHGDHYTSHAFANIFLVAIERYLQNELEQSKAALPSSSSSTTASSSNTHLTGFVEEEGENTVTIEENFSIERSTDLQQAVLINLRIDYQYRSPTLQSVCLYQFVSLFHRKLFTSKDRNVTEHSSTSTEGVHQGPGRPLQERHLFMTEHPQATSHGLIKRSKPVVPVLIGPQIPRKDREETQERYSRAIATLFIPWRSVKDLCDVNQSWCEALSSRQGNITRESQQVIDNIQLLHECKKDRDSHLQQVIANVQANDEIDPRLFPRNMHIDSDDDDEETDQSETHLHFLDSVSDSSTMPDIGHLSKREQLYQDEALRCLGDVGRFTNLSSKIFFFPIKLANAFLLGNSQLFVASDSLSHFSVKTRHSDQQNTLWQAAIKSETLLRRQQSLSQDTSSFDDACNESVSTATMNTIAENTIQNTDRLHLVTVAASQIPTRHQVSERFTLNDDQARAFYIVCRHVDGDSHLKRGKHVNFFLLCFSCVFLQMENNSS